MQPLKSFWNKPSSNSATFEQERPQKLGYETVSTLHRTKNDILPFFKFLQKKVSRLDRKALAHFYTTLGVVIWKNHVVRPLKSFNKYRNFFGQAWKLFFCRNLENVKMSFLGRCNVETVSCRGFSGLSCSKVAGFEGGLFQKHFKGYIFCFLGHLVGGQLFELFARETNLKKESSVLLINVMSKNNLHRYKLHQIFQFFMDFHTVKRRMCRFFKDRTKQVQHQHPVLASKQYSSSSKFQYCYLEGTFDWFQKPLLTLLDKWRHTTFVITFKVFCYLNFSLVNIQKLINFFHLTMFCKPMQQFQ